MSDSNPFAKLQGLLKPNASSTIAGKGSSDSPSTSARPTRPANPVSPHKKQVEHDEESALFLHSVNKLSQSSSGTQAQQEDTAFKQAMQAAGIIPVGKKNKGKKNKKRSSSQASSPLQNPQESPSSPDKPHNANDGGQIGQTIPDHIGSQQAVSQQTGQNQRATKTPPKGDAPSFRAPGNATTPNALSEDLDEQEFALFAEAMNDVAPVSKRGREIHAPSEAKTSLHPSGKTPAQIMQEIIDGRIEFAIQHTGEYMEGFVQGVSPEVLEKLRLGQFSPEGHIDLHGLNALQAYTELTRFIKNAYQRNMRTVTVITGRGINSPDGIAVIRNLIQEWLTHDPFKRAVLAFCSAQPRDGGAGALYVLLRKYKKSMGKIQWELPYSGPNADF